MMNWLVFFFFVVSAHAKIENYFKKATEKSGVHQMRNIDFIYMINLDQRPEKFAACIQQLSLYGIHPYRFSAVNGWELSLEAINDLGIKFEPWMAGSGWGTRFVNEGWGTSFLLDGGGEPYHSVLNVVGRTYFSHCMAQGPIGIVLSHLSVLQDALDSGYETIWVMEDDIEVIRDPSILSDLIDQLDSFVGEENWDLFFTDRDTKNNQGKNVPCTSYAWRPNFSPSNPSRFAEKQEISLEIRRIGARYGAYSIIVRKSGMQKILDFFKQYQIFLPYDMEYTLPPDIQIYTVIHDVVSTQIGAPSDNGAPNYLKRAS